MKRRLCALLALALCAALLTPMALASEENLHTDYAVITHDGFVADSLNGVDAIYNLTISSPDCLEYIQRYYQTLYGLSIQASGHAIWVANSDVYTFVQTDTPAPGDIGYASAAERGKSCGHYVMCKEADAASGTITLIEQNWIWDGKAGLNRTIAYTGSCYTFYTLTAADGASLPERSSAAQDSARETTGMLSAAQVGSVFAGGRSAADILGSGSVAGTISSWASTTLSRAREWGITAGAALDAGAAITRGQFAQLLVNTAYALGLDADPVFSQTEAARLGLMMGDTQGNFDAEGTLTREQAALVLARLWQLTGDTLPADVSVLSQFADAGSISTWAREGAAIAVSAGLFGGTGRGFEPSGALTCEQAVALLARAYAARMYLTI